MVDKLLYVLKELKKGKSFYLSIQTTAIQLLKIMKIKLFAENIHRQCSNFSLLNLFIKTLLIET